jgi:hypothetical protein
MALSRATSPLALLAEKAAKTAPRSLTAIYGHL